MRGILAAHKIKKIWQSIRRELDMDKNINLKISFKIVIVIFFGFILGYVLIFSSFWPSIFQNFRGVELKQLATFADSPYKFLVAIPATLIGSFIVKKLWFIEQLSQRFSAEFVFISLMLILFIGLCISGFVWVLLTPIVDFSK